MAGAGVDVKMGVSGVAQFKQGMKESQASVKSLEQALKLNEAQFKLTGDAEETLKEKSKLLAQQFEAQSSVVKQGQDSLEAMTKMGVNPASIEFQKMQQSVYKAQTDLANIQAEMDSVGGAGEEAQSGISHMNQSLQRIGANVNFETVINGINKITDGLEATAQKAVNLGKKMVHAMLSGGQWADEIGELAEKWEVSPEVAYRMQQTALEIDTSAETIIEARKRLITAMGKESDKETMGAFAALGITYLEGTDDNIENIFWRAGEALMDFDDKVARNEYAMKLYGKSWTELIPIFKAGRQKYEEEMASWTWIGDQEFKNLTEMDDKRHKLESEWEAFVHKFEATLAPTMTKTMETIQGLLKEFNNYLQTEQGQEMLNKLGEAVSGLFEDLAKIDPEGVINNLTSAFNKITEGFQWLIKNRQGVVDAMEYIVGGWAALKITGGALQVMQLINGAKGLRGASGGNAAEAGGTEESTGNTGSAGNGGTIFSRILDTAVNAAQVKSVLDETARLLNWGGMQWSSDPMANAAQFNKIGLENGWISEKDAEQNRKMAELFASSSDRMMEVADEMTTAVNTSSQSSVDMTAAATALMDLPGLMKAAVADAIGSLNITIDASGIDAMQPRIAGGIFDHVIQMTK